jgi:hypothetical protein
MRQSVTGTRAPPKLQYQEEKGGNKNYKNVLLDAIGVGD